MTTLPKILYFFRTLPVKVPAFYLQLLQNRLLSFGHKSAPESPALFFTLIGCEAGWVFQILQNIIKQHKSPNSPCSMLRLTSPYGSFWRYLTVHRSPSPPYCGLSVRYSSKLMSPFLPLLPLLNNPMLPPGLEQPHVFLWWPAHGFSQVCHFLRSHTFPKWSSVQEALEAPSVKFFCYIQLWHWITSLRHNDTFLYHKITFEHTCLHSPCAPVTISIIYSFLSSNSASTSLSYVLKWEQDLSTIDLADWNKAWSSIAKCSFDMATLEAAYKVLLRCH